MLRDKDKPAWSRILIYLSVVSVIMAIVGAAGTDIYLASSQWLLVGALTALWGIYLLLEANYRLHK